MTTSTSSKDPVYCVSSFHRSGSSMMMRCLALSSSLEAVTEPELDDWSAIFFDGDYHPNPNGFYQSSDFDVDLPYFYAANKGRLIKIARASLNLVPQGRYKLIFMTREPTEIIASMRKFTPYMPFAAEANVYLYDEVKNATIKQLRSRGDFEILEVKYNDVVKDPVSQFQRVKAFGFPIDVEKAASLVDQSLYRFRLES